MPHGYRDAGFVELEGIRVGRVSRRGRARVARLPQRASTGRHFGGGRTGLRSTSSRLGRSLEQGDGNDDPVVVVVPQPRVSLEKSPEPREKQDERREEQVDRTGHGKSDPKRSRPRLAYSEGAGGHHTVTIAQASRHRLRCSRQCPKGGRRSLLGRPAATHASAKNWFDTWSPRY